MPETDQFVFFAVGVIISCIADRAWKYEGKRLRFFDHYHHGIILVGLSLFADNIISHVLLGAGTALIIQEIYQDKPFAKNSDHFVLTSVIGAVFCIVFIILIIITLYE